VGWFTRRRDEDDEQDAEPEASLLEIEQDPEMRAAQAEVDAEPLTPRSEPPPPDYLLT